MKTRSMNTLWHPARIESPYLMLVLHDRGESMHELTNLPAGLEIPNLNYLFLNAPYNCADGYSWLNGTGGANFKEGRSFRLLENILEEIEADGYRREDLIFFGFCEGMQAALEFCLRSDSTFRGCVGVSGEIRNLEQISREMTPEARRIPWLFTYGSAEENLSPEKMREQINQLRSRGLSVHAVEYLKGRQLEPVGEIPIIGSWLRRLMI